MTPQITSDSLLFGNMKTYVADPLAFLEKHAKTEGDIFQFRVAHRTLTFVNKPEWVHHILYGNHRNYRKNLAYRKLSLLLGQGLFTSEGDFWRNQRRLAQPAFHRKQIASYADIMETCTKEMLAQWKSKGEIELCSEMTQLTLRVISQCILGLDLNEKEGAVQKHLPYALQFMVKRITSAMNAPMWLPTDSNKRFQTAVKALDNDIQAIILAKRKKLGEDLLSTLIKATDEETGQGMSDEQLRDEVMTFFLAGHETSAISLCWTIQLLLEHEECLEKLVKELESAKDNDLGTLLSLPYLDACIKESLRLRSPIWILGREALGPDHIGDHQIEQGDSIIFSPFLMHQHPDYWMRPKDFVPERFMQDIPEKAYLPFGAGPRTCIGEHFAMMEIKLILANMLKAFDFSLLDASPVEFEHSLTLRPAKEMKLRLTAKQQCPA